MSTRAVVTGLGIVAPTGLGAQNVWAATRNGKLGLHRLDRFDPTPYPVTVVGQVRDFDPAALLPSRVTCQTDLMTQFCLVAADQALADAGLNAADLPEYQMSVVIANATGGAEFGQREMQNLYTRGPQAVGAYMAIAWFYAANSGQVSIRHGMRGPSSVIVADQAGGLDALGHARRLIRGGTGYVLAGGTDSSFSPSGLVAQLPLGLVSTGTDPTTAYLPFDSSAAGYSPAEGSAVLMVEHYDTAIARGAAIYGEIAGYASAFDPPPASGRPPVLRAAIEAALADAATRPDDVDVVFADAFADPRLDRLESEALAAVFGPGGVRVTAPKTAIGRMYAAGPPTDVLTALLCIRDGLIPPTINVRELAPGCSLDLVRDEAIEADVRTALVLARGHRGFTAALVVRAVD